VSREHKPLPEPKSQQRWPRIRIQISTLIQIWMFAGPGCLPDSCQDIVDSFSCRHQSFCYVLSKSGSDCMKNVNKSPKNPHSAMVREVEKWSGIHIRDRITTKSYYNPTLDNINNNTNFIYFVAGLAANWYPCRPPNTVAVWLSGNALVSLNKVTVCRARLVPGWVTVLRWVNHLGQEPATQVNSACTIPPWVGTVSTSKSWE